MKNAIKVNGIKITKIILSINRLGSKLQMSQNVPFSECSFPGMSLSQTEFMLHNTLHGIRKTDGAILYFLNTERSSQ